ncbi:helix-turn-helix domain-containing protein [Spongiactinospora rosea]|uniref:helix-turn-helix domain-containing protein n=1 Tax=Spongiactinospora rosea TaxID=2248750 RepID=UPI001CEC305C|nr:helix-turn-helix transcriptional regulator [Spongiactinospora rosea]
MKILRESIGMTQEQMAETLRVDQTTVQSWESGRRPLMAIATGNYLRLRSLMLRSGVDSLMLFHLDLAVEADRFVAYILNSDPGKVDDTDHPLSSWVMTGPFTELLAWPFTTIPPVGLQAATARISRRGPVAGAPLLHGDEKAHFFRHLRQVAESADPEGEGGMLLRRQAHYIASFDSGGEIAEWLISTQRAEERRLDRSSMWTPSWAVARSGAHSLARLGDHDALPRFVETRFAEEQCEVANLNYWAYWIGEIGESQWSDTFMITMDPDSWGGARLARHLIDRLSAQNPYIDVIVHTLWALISKRPTALAPPAADDLTAAVCRVLDEGTVSPGSKRKLDSVLYAVRMIRRQ